ncbi:hypothetical protein FOZ62_027493, partial [Perkinsus olseni]
MRSIAETSNLLHDDWPLKETLPVREIILLRRVTIIPNHRNHVANVLDAGGAVGMDDANAVVYSAALPIAPLVSSVLASPTGAEPHRQQEILPTGAIGTLTDSQRLGFTHYFKHLLGKAMRQGHNPKMAYLHTCDFVPHNTGQYVYGVVNKVRILRVKDGQTSEYTADVVGGGKCFDNIHQVKDDSHGQGYDDLPRKIEIELQRLCDDGFSALHPFPQSSVEDGLYTGSRMRRSVSLGFQKGQVSEASLTLREADDEEDYYVTYHRLCNGVISVIVPGMDSPLGETSERSQRKAAADVVDMDDEEGAGLLASDDESNVLCNVGD